MKEFEHLLVYLGPGLTALTLVVSVWLSFNNAKLDSRFAKFKEDFMEALDKKFLHREVAEARLTALDEKLELLVDLTEHPAQRRHGR